MDNDKIAILIDSSKADYSKNSVFLGKMDNVIKKRQPMSLVNTNSNND